MAAFMRECSAESRPSCTGALPRDLREFSWSRFCAHVVVTYPGGHSRPRGPTPQPRLRLLVRADLRDLAEGRRRGRAGARRLHFAVFVRGAFAPADGGGGDV